MSDETVEISVPQAENSGVSHVTDIVNKFQEEQMSVSGNIDNPKYVTMFIRSELSGEKLTLRDIEDGMKAFLGKRAKEGAGLTGLEETADALKKFVRPFSQVIERPREVAVDTTRLPAIMDREDQMIKSEIDAEVERLNLKFSELRKQQQEQWRGKMQEKRGQIQRLIGFFKQK